MTPALTLALAGDTMLGRGVAARLREAPRAPLLDPALVEAAEAADLFVLNLECCISDRGRPVREPGRPFSFRAPPVAAQRLAELGVRCVTLANNHVLDFGPDALADTLAYLAAAGIDTAGAGLDRNAARSPATLSLREQPVRVVAIADHPASYRAAAERPGIAFADLRRSGVPDWLVPAARPEDDEVVLIAAHWGPNMTPAPVRHVRAAAAALVSAGATLIVGHSAHVPHGACGRVLFDLGDFLDDYAVDPWLRNDLSLLWLVTLERDAIRRVEGVPLRLENAYTRAADGSETRELVRLMRRRCAAVGTEVDLVGDRLVFTDDRAGGTSHPPAGSRRPR